MRRAPPFPIQIGCPPSKDSMSRIGLPSAQERELRNRRTSSSAWSELVLLSSNASKTVGASWSVSGQRTISCPRKETRLSLVGQGTPLSTRTRRKRFTSGRSVARSPLEPARHQPVQRQEHERGDDHPPHCDP